MPRGPDFICIGLQKAGTRWLYDQMAAADGVWMPPIKELNYFTGNCFKPLNLALVAKRDAAVAAGAAETVSDREFFEYFKRGQARGVDLDWYHGLFPSKGMCLAGDVSPEYARMTADQIHSMAASRQNCKYVLLLRDPVSRFWSALCMRVRSGRVEEEKIGRWTDVKEILSKTGDQSFPTRIWRRWSAMLPQGSLRFWFIEDIATKPELVREEIYRFIGGSSDLQSSLPASFNRKRSNRKYVMNAEIHLGLATYFNEEIQEAADLFGGHAVAWMRENRVLLRSAR